MIKEVLYIITVYNINMNMYVYIYTVYIPTFVYKYNLTGNTLTMMLRCFNQLVYSLKAKLTFFFCQFFPFEPYILVLVFSLEILFIFFTGVLLIYGQIFSFKGPQNSGWLLLRFWHGIPIGLRKPF